MLNIVRSDSMLERHDTLAWGVGGLMDCTGKKKSLFKQHALETLQTADLLPPIVPVFCYCVAF